MKGSWSVASRGVAGLLPVPSLGHGGLEPAVVDPLVRCCASDLRRDWQCNQRGLATSIAPPEVTDADQCLAWPLVLATIPVDLSRPVLEHVVRVYVSMRVLTAAFLTRWFEDPLAAAVRGVLPRRRDRLPGLVRGALSSGSPGHGHETERRGPVAWLFRPRLALSEG